MTTAKIVSKRVEVSEDPQAINDFYYQKGWTEGLPIVCPTEERVLRMLEYTDRAPDEVLGQLAPVYAEATIEKVAINAVMAGCLPQHMPVLIAAVQAIVEKDFNLYGVQTTTNPVTPLFILNGPIAKELDVNSGPSCMGPCKRANAVIGRAMRLLMINVGGGKPSAVDKATFGQPAKFTFCIAENEEANQWEPLHVERGFKKEDSTVTTCGIASIINVVTTPEIIPGWKEGDQILALLADNMAAMGSNNFMSGIGEPLIAFSPESAGILKKDGYSKLDVKRILFEKSHRMAASLPPFTVDRMRHRRGLAKSVDKFYITEKPEDIMIVVCGGLLAAHTVFMPTFGTTQAQTKAIAKKDGTRVRSVEEFKAK